MRVERKLAAILAADVVGYSRLIAEDEARTLDALRSLRRESFEPLVEKHRGEVVKRMGNSWLATRHFVQMTGMATAPHPDGRR